MVFRLHPGWISGFYLLSVKRSLHSRHYLNYFCISNAASRGLVSSQLVPIRARTCASLCMCLLKIFTPDTKWGAESIVHNITAWNNFRCSWHKHLEGHYLPRIFWWRFHQTSRPLIMCSNFWCRSTWLVTLWTNLWCPDVISPVGLAKYSLVSHTLVVQL